MPLIMKLQLRDGRMALVSLALPRNFSRSSLSVALLRGAPPRAGSACPRPLPRQSVSLAPNGPLWAIAVLRSDGVSGESACGAALRYDVFTADVGRWRGSEWTFQGTVGACFV